MQAFKSVLENKGLSCHRTLCISSKTSDCIPPSSQNLSSQLLTITFHRIFRLTLSSDI